MKPNVIFLPESQIKRSDIVAGNFIYIYNSNDVNHTLGFITLDKNVHWIPLVEDSDGTSDTATNTDGTVTSTESSTNTETEEADNGSRTEKNPDSAGQ